MDLQEQLRRHGYISSDDSDGGKSDFDEEYYKYQPPPVPEKDIKAFIISAPSENQNSNAATSSSENGKKTFNLGSKEVRESRSEIKPSHYSKHSHPHQNTHFQPTDSSSRLIHTATLKNYTNEVGILEGHVRNGDQPSSSSNKNIMGSPGFNSTPYLKTPFQPTVLPPIVPLNGLGTTTVKASRTDGPHAVEVISDQPIKPKKRLAPIPGPSQTTFNNNNPFKDDAIKENQSRFNTSSTVQASDNLVNTNPFKAPSSYSSTSGRRLNSRIVEIEDDSKNTADINVISTIFPSSESIESVVIVQDASPIGSLGTSNLIPPESDEPKVKKTCWQKVLACLWCCFSQAYYYW